MNVLTAVVCWAVVQAPPTIDVVYPRIAPGDTIPYIDKVDSNFVFGSVQPLGSRLWIDGVEAPVNGNGSFLVFQPVDWRRKRYTMAAISGEDTASFEVPFAARPAKPPVATTALAPLDFPRLLELSGQPLRTDPRGTYFIFPSAGTRVLTTGFSAGYFRLSLAPGRSAWVEARTVRSDLGKTSPPDPSAIWKIDLDTLGGGVSLFIPIDRKLLVRLADDSDPDRIVLEIFGAVSHIDRISYAKGSELVREVTWEQTADACVKLEIKLARPLWGYSSHWEEKGFRLKLRPSPAVGRRLAGLRVAIDPGHGGQQDGSIGPTRRKEKQANLTCAEALARQLVKSGATVFMTLDRDSTLGLPDRTAAAEQFDADILVSLHHNALPDGVNPFGYYGTGTHFYRSQSRELAIAVQNAVVAELGLPDEGIYFDDLALVRPTAQPAILLEAAYMMLPAQEMLIGSEDYPKRLARAVEKGIASFVHERLTR